MCILSSMLPQPKGATFLGKVNSALPGFHKQISPVANAISGGMASGTSIGRVVN